MALRKLFAVAMVLGGTLAVGCGGSTGKVAFDPGDDEAPNNSGDQPPLNGDQASSNSDRPPTSTERPPLNPDSPGGGRLQELCDKLCEVVDRCDTGMSMGDMDLDQLCGMNLCSQVPAAVQAQIPCLDETIALFDCALSLPNLCAAEDSGQGEANAQLCEDAAEGFEHCIDDYEMPSTGNPDGDPPVQNCTMAGGCQNCPNSCGTCTCRAGTDTDANIECLMSEACTNPTTP